MNAVVANLLRAPRIVFAKRTVRRRRPPFALDLDRFAEADYSRIVPRLAEIERRLRALPADALGLRWIHEAETVLFLGERRLEIRFDDFVRRVDIGHVGRLYRDALGTATVVVARDALGRTLRQGVRVVALPQPNYAAFMGKGELDVYKLESVDHGADAQRVWMRTVLSPNGSAVCDDGFVAFERSADGAATTVAFLACQNFPVPPLMALARLDRWRWFKRLVTESAYRRFFEDMMANVVACHAGADFRIGRADVEACAGAVGRSGGAR